MPSSVSCERAREGGLLGRRLFFELVRKRGAPEAVSGGVERIERDRTDIEPEGVRQAVPALGLLGELAPHVGRPARSRAEAIDRIEVRRDAGAREDVGRRHALVAAQPAGDHEAIRQRAGRPGHEVFVEADAQPARRHALEHGRHAQMRAVAEEVRDAVSLGAAPRRDARPHRRRDHRLDRLELGSDATRAQRGEGRQLSGRERAVDQRPRAPVDAEQHDASAGRRCSREPEGDAERGDAHARHVTAGLMVPSAPAGCSTSPRPTSSSPRISWRRPARRAPLRAVRATSAPGSRRVRARCGRRGLPIGSLRRVQCCCRCRGGCHRRG